MPARLRALLFRLERKNYIWGAAVSAFLTYWGLRALGHGSHELWPLVFDGIGITLMLVDVFINLWQRHTKTKEEK